MKHKLYLCLMLMAVVIGDVITVFSQQPAYRSFTSENGLPSEIIYDLAFDDKEILWLGTQTGLVMYDGTSFKLVPSKNIRFNLVSEIQFDRNGVLWCQNYSNQILYLQNDTLRTNEDLNSTIAKHGDIFGFKLLENENALYVITFKKFLKVSYPSLTVDVLFEVPKGDKTMIFDLYLKQNDTVGILKGRNMMELIEFHAGKIIAKKKSSFFHRNPHAHYKLMHGRQGIGFVSSKTGSDRYFWEKGGQIESSEIPIKGLSPDLFVNYMRETEDGIWLCTNRGLRYMNVEGAAKSEIDVLLPEYNVSDIISDFEGNYWVSTVNGGLFMIPNLQILTYTSKDLNLKETGVTKMESAGGNEVLIGTKSGHLVLFDENMDRKGVWTSGKSGDIEFILYDKANERFFTDFGYFYTYGSTFFNYWYVKDATLLKNGYLLIASSSEASIVNPDNPLEYKFDGLKPFLLKYKTYLKKSPPIYNSITIRNVRSRAVFYNSKNEEYWIGFIDGLHKYDKNAKDEVLNLPDGSPIYASSITSMGDSIIWVGTTQKGLVGIKHGKVNYWLKEEDGLLSDQINRVITKGQYIWLATGKGVQRYEFSKGEWRNFTYNNGLPSNEVKDIAITDHFLWIGTYKGLTRIPIDFVQVKSNPPKIYLNKVEVNDSLVQGNNLKLNYFQNRIRFSFTGISYRSRELLRYKYRLSGLDTVWRYSLTSREDGAYYAALKPGKYRFEVKSINDMAVESAETAVFEFEISQPFWMEAWFYVVLVLLISALGISFYRNRLSRVKKESEVMLERKNLEVGVNKARYKSLQTQMNPHFLFNSMNAIQHLINMDKKDEANLYLVEFSRLLRGTLEKADDLLVTIEDEVDLLNRYLKMETYRVESGLTYEIKVDPELDIHTQLIPALITHPFVENSIIHGIIPSGKPGNIRVEFVLMPGGAVYCSIEDNGIGRAKSAQIKSEHIYKQKSMGTQLINDRIDLINKIYDVRFTLKIIDLYTDAGNPSGTKVEIVMPSLT